MRHEDRPAGRRYDPPEARGPAPELPRVRGTHRWRPALLAGNGNSVVTSGGFGRILVLTTLFYGPSSHNTVTVGRGFRSKGLVIRVQGFGSSVTIGDDVTWSGQISLAGNGIHVTIGDRADAKTTTMTAWEASIEIGSDCLIASGVDIRSSDIHPIFDRESGELLNPGSDVVVGNRVWIARGVTILKGTRVPEGCVLGAASVVSGRFEEPDAIIAGVPARVVRTGIVWRR